MQSNINTPDYWDTRFRTGEWSAVGGGSQTDAHIKALLPHLPIPNGFAGSILDFGCALGEAIPILRTAFPHAQLHGVDVSLAAIQECRRRYPAMATFSVAEADTAPHCDIILAAHVMEHLADDVSAVTSLLSRCKVLCVAVPFMEDPNNLFTEHLRSYSATHYQHVAGYRECHALPSAPRTGRHFFRILWQVHMKNLMRKALGRHVVKTYKQILYTFDGAMN